MIRRKLTRIELQLDDTKELDELFSKPSTLGVLQTGLFSLASHKAFQNPTIYEKQLQTDTSVLQQNNQPSEQATVASSAAAVAPSSSTTNNPTVQPVATTSSEIQERIGYNPQPYNPNNRFQFNQSSIR